VTLAAIDVDDFGAPGVSIGQVAVEDLTCALLGSTRSAAVGLHMRNEPSLRSSSA
jgi:hypothetical protein